MTSEFKKLMGCRQSDSDGFTYVYGKYKDGRSKHRRNRNQTTRCIRNDKRSVRGKELRRCKKEEEE